MRRIFTLIFVCGCYFAQTQTITVLDKTTREAIPGAIIYGGSATQVIQTDKRGKADLTKMGKTDSIQISYYGYRGAKISVNDLATLKFQIELLEENISLAEVIVSSNRWEEEKIETPNKIEKISKKQVEFLNPQTSADVLETSGYAYVQKSQMAGGSPMLRGFATNRVLLVVDGVRMNNAIFRSGNLQNVISIDANALENAEILFGPGAVMYGSDAIGGVMDFHTLRPKFADSISKRIFKVNAFSRFSSANMEKTGHLDFNIDGQKWSSLTSFSYSDYNDLRAGTIGNRQYLRPSYVITINGRDSMFTNKDPSLQVGSAFGQLNVIQKIHFKPTEHLNFQYDFHYSATSNASRYDRLYIDLNKDNILDNAEWYYGPQKWMMNRLAVIHNKKTKLYDQFKIVAALQNFEESRHDRRFNSKLLRHQTEKVDALSFNLDLDKKINSRTTLFYGAESIYNLVTSEANRQNIETKIKTASTTRYPTGSTWQAYGAYANLKYKHSSKVVLNSGLRYSYFAIDAIFDTTFIPLPFTRAQNKNGALNGSLGFIYLPSNNWQVYANLSSGFRSPNIDDIGKVFESQPGFVVVPNANLRPEYAYNAEFGTARAFGNRLKLDAAVYYTMLNNALARRDFQYAGQDSIFYDGELSRVLAIQNITRAYVYGVQAGVEINLSGGFLLTSKISYQKGQEQSEDSLLYFPKPHVAPLFGNTHFIYARKKLKLDFYLNYNGKMQYQDLPLSDRQDYAVFAIDADGLPFTPAWYTLNFKAAFYYNENFSLTGGVENITDQLYRSFSSGISAPGRNFIVSLRYKL